MLFKITTRRHQHSEPTSVASLFLGRLQPYFKILDKDYNALHNIYSVRWRRRKKFWRQMKRTGEVFLSFFFHAA